MALAHCTLATRDVAASAAFFQETLNWQPIDRPGNLLMGSAWLQIAADQELHLLEVDDFEVSPFEREFGRHIAVSWPLEGILPRDRSTPADTVIVTGQEYTSRHYDH